MTNNESTPAAIKAWFSQRLDQDWTATPAEVVVDREEITVVITLAPPPSQGEEEAAAAEAVAGLIARWRADTRERRIAIAREAEHRFERKVAWGVTVDGRREIFTHIAVPVMTRLRQPERLVLDTLVDAGVARSRAHALAWCVKAVARNSEAWLGDLREAMTEVERVRQSGPAT